MAEEKQGITDAIQQVSNEGVLDVAVTCQLDGAHRDALLSVDVRLDGSNMDREVAHTVRWYLYESGKADIIASSPPESVEFNGKSSLNSIVK